jgi:hypothetical protein
MSSLILPARFREQPQYPVELADAFAHPDALAFVGGQSRIIGAGYASVGTITHEAAPGGEASRSDTTTSYINAGKVFHAQPGRWVTIARIVSLDTTLRTPLGLTNGLYIERCFLNANHTESASAGRVAWQFRSIGGAQLKAGSTDPVLTVGKPITLVWSMPTSTTLDMAADGQNVPITYGGTGVQNSAEDLTGGGYDLLNFNNTNNHAAGTGAQLLMWARLPIAGLDIESLSADPWQIFQSPDQTIYFDLGAGGGAAALEGAAAAAASAAADLSTAIPLAGSSAATASATGDLALDVSLEGAAAVSATATADLSTAIPFAGVSVSIASAAGTITTAIQLDGSAAAVSVSGGDLVTSISLSGASLAQAAAAAALSTGIPLAGTASGTAAASGSLTAGSGMEGSAASLATAIGTLTAEIRLSGAALAQALASADLTAPGSGLVGDAAAQSSATGLLGTSIPLVGPATATAGAAGELGSAILLSGAAAAISSATGDLTLSISLEGYSLAQALAAGTLSTAITLSGAALAQAISAGSLTGAVRATPAFRTRVVKMKPRLLRIAA